MIPNEKISYEWRFEGYAGSGITEFELIEEQHKTKLKLTFSVISKFPDNIPEFKRQSGIDGWNYFIKSNLKNI